MMYNSSYQSLLSRGRKAGLTARELNSALSMRPVQGHEQQPGHTDCNGFLTGIDARGHRTARPADDAARS